MILCTTISTLAVTMSYTTFNKTYGKIIKWSKGRNGLQTFNSKKSTTPRTQRFDSRKSLFQVWGVFSCVGASSLLLLLTMASWFSERHQARAFRRCRMRKNFNHNQFSFTNQAVLVFKFICAYPLQLFSVGRRIFLPSSNIINYSRAS